MYDDLRNAVQLLYSYCITHTCNDCPLYRAVCHIPTGYPAAYSLEQFDVNVKELESEEEE